MFVVILKLKAAGMSNVIYAQYPTDIQNIIKQLYYTENCEIDFHDFSKTFWVYLFSKSIQACRLLMTCPGFSCPYETRM